MHTFRDGDLISAEKVNENFTEAADGEPITCQAMPGWSILQFAGRRQGSTATINLSVQRTGSTINASPGVAQVVGTLSADLTPHGGTHEVGMIPSTGGYFFVLRVIGRQLTLKSFGQGSYPAGTRWIGAASWVTK